MSNENAPRASTSDLRATDHQIGETSTHEENPAATDLPMPEAHQPDPMLQMTTGRMGAGSTTLVAVVIAFIIAVVFYGLNSHVAPEHTAAAPSAAQGSPLAAGGKSGPPTPSAPRANESGNKG
jgi:hypothetical protein